ncbi:MAG: hypothetical protein IJS88_00790 [Alphaproteobacteria bacterium]|nr:hypothetical protein [Alphaproteobacteria bacterium]
MQSLIVRICGILAVLFPLKSVAQVDLEELMNDNIAAEETPNTADNDISAQHSETAVDASNAEETEEELYEDTATESEDKDNNFMTQYINELDEQDRYRAEEEKLRSDASLLIKQKDHTDVLSEETHELFEKSEKIRQEQKELLKNSPLPEFTSTAASQQIATKSTEKESKVGENIELKAPFGLTWGISKEQTEADGFKLRASTIENRTGAYLVENPRQQRAAFKSIIAIFGEQNHLQMIYAQSPLLDDTPNAEKVLQLYHEYFAALSKKYGNAKEHYQPNKSQNMPASEIGNDTFLQDLKDEKTFLFATFGNDAIKVTLSVFVNEDTRSFIVLNYENTTVCRQEQEENLNELINDL